MTRIDMTAPEWNSQALRNSVLSRLIIYPETGCLLWQGGKDSGGYGNVKAAGRTGLVHRLMFTWFEGPIPDDLELDHVKARGCRYRHCASPAHLEVVTRQENCIRAAVTHCPAGHEYDLLNTYWTPSGKRDCRACQRKREAAYRARRRGATA